MSTTKKRVRHFLFVFQGNIQVPSQEWTLAVAGKQGLVRALLTRFNVAERREALVIAFDSFPAFPLGRFGLKSTVHSTMLGLETKSRKNEHRSDATLPMLHAFTLLSLFCVIECCG